MVLLALAAIVILGATAAAIGLLALERPATVVVGAGLLVAAQMQLAVVACGAGLGDLAPVPLLLTQVAVSAGLLVAVGALVGIDRHSWRRGWSPSRRWFRSRRSEGPAFAADPSSELDVARPRPSCPERAIRAVRRHPLHVAIAAVVAALYAWHVGLALALPAVDYDGLALHGTAIAHWVTTGSFAASDLSPMVDSAPLGPAAISAWTATFTSDLSWVFLTQVGFAVLGAAAVADLAERFGARRCDALVAACAFAGMPVVALQAVSGYPDLAAASTVVAAWALWAGVIERGSVADPHARPSGARADRRDLALIGVALGLAIAARPANLAAAAFLLLAALVGPLVVQRRADPERAPALGVLARRAAILLVPLVVLGGYWYVRNGVVHANPLYPFDIGPLRGLGSVDRLIVAPNRPDTLTAVGGRVAQTATSWLSDLSPGPVAVDQRLGGFGPIFPLVLLPASVVLVVSDRRLVVRATYALAVVLLVVVPTPWWSRGTLFVPAVAAAGLGAVLSTLTGTRRTAVLGVVAVMMGIGAAVTVHETAYVASATHRHVGPAAAVSLARQRDPHLITPYDGYRWLDQRWPDATVAVVEGSVPSLRVPLFGPSLQRRIVVVPPAREPEHLARSVRRAGADLVLVRAADGELLDAIGSPRSPLVVVASGSQAPSGMVVVALRG